MLNQFFALLLRLLDRHLPYAHRLIKRLQCCTRLTVHLGWRAVDEQAVANFPDPAAHLPHVDEWGCFTVGARLARVAALAGALAMC